MLLLRRFIYIHTNDKPLEDWKQTNCSNRLTQVMCDGGAVYFIFACRGYVSLEDPNETKVLTTCTLLSHTTALSVCSMKVTFLLGALVSCDGRWVSSVNTSFFSSSCKIFCLSSGGVKTESFLASRRLYLIVISKSMLFFSSYSSVTKGDVPPHSSINGSSYVTFVNSFLPSYRRSSVVFSFSSTSCFNFEVSSKRNGG